MSEFIFNSHEISTFFSASADKEAANKYISEIFSSFTFLVNISLSRTSSFIKFLWWFFSLGGLRSEQITFSAP